MGRLRLADVSFEKRMHDDAINRYSNFIGYHPNHPKVPYARLMIAESHAERIPSESIFFFLHQRKRSSTCPLCTSVLPRSGLSHPEGDEAQKARDGIQRVRKLLGKHELYVAEFYFKRDKFKAALNRADGLAKPTQDSDSTSKHSELRRKVTMLWETMTKRRSSTKNS